MVWAVASRWKLSAIDSTRRTGRGLLIGVFAAVVAQGAPASDHADLKFIGAQTCGQSTCHAAGEPWFNSAVQQNEYHVWRDSDPHSKAYATLQTEAALGMADRLGLGEPTTEGLCLTCHANNVAPERRGREFDITNGVTCESCHGPAEEWLSTHISGATFPGDNYQAGMYPTAEPVARAQLCMSCHVGGNDTAVTHRLMAAGHPRTPFELDTYTVSQPAHFKIDNDYHARKTVSGITTVWATGQALHATRMLDRLAALTRHPAYVFTEYSLFDCHSCHQPADASNGAASGGAVPRINDAHFLMVEIIARHTDPQLGGRIAQEIRSLRSAVSTGWQATHEASLALGRSVDELSGRVRSLDHRDAKQLMASILERTTSGGVAGYLEIEQAILAVATLVDAQKVAGSLDGTQYEAMKRELARCYAAAKDDESVDLNAIRSAFANMRTLLSSS